jgi:hypothetical protein
VKKTLATIFAAPGRVRAERDVLTVDLAPAGSSPERAAFGEFFAKVNAAGLRLPDDAGGHQLRFGVQT